MGFKVVGFFPDNFLWVGLGLRSKVMYMAFLYIIFVSRGSNQIPRFPFCILYNNPELR